MSTADSPAKQNTQRKRKRLPKACTRCRDQKIKCDGADPCHQCHKRGFACHFTEEPQTVVVSQRRLADLEERLAYYEGRLGASACPAAGSDDVRISQSSLPAEGIGPVLSPATPAEARSLDGEAPLTNPLAFHATDWIPGPRGSTLFMGTSSDWSFSRRTLTMTYEAVTGEPLPTEGLLFDGDVYDLGWDGQRVASTPTSPHQDALGPSSLPPEDFAIHLINTVKFRFGDLYYLIDEPHFMNQFALFYRSAGKSPDVSPLWYIHYLMILAFGKAFVVQISKAPRPPGAELFVQAMKLLPDLTFLKCDPIEKLQVLCCAALYLQSVQCRPAAHRMIGQAVAVALEHGMHTEMRSDSLDEGYVARCRRLWWTIHILERYISSHLGVPMAVTDDFISTPYHTFPDDAQKTAALQIQVRLSQVLSLIQHTVYGLDGQLDGRYLDATRSVLRNIATVAEQVNRSFEIQVNEAAPPRLSRIAAHLHLQHHQCIVLTTRPLLYIFFQCRVCQSRKSLMRWLELQSIRGLLQMCTESARQILRILSVIMNQGLLETFLPFDLDATFSSCIAILMAATIEPTLIPDYAAWSQRAYAVLDEMSSRGNAIAKMHCQELRHLESLLNRLSSRGGATTAMIPPEAEGPGEDAIGGDLSATDSLAFTSHDARGGNSWIGYFDHDFELGAGQLMDLANSLDFSSLPYM